MQRTEKERLVTELREKIEGARALYYTDFTGLNVKNMTELRRRFRRAGVEYVVVKNTLALRAASEAGVSAERLRGPTGVVIGADPVVAARILSDFAREHEQRPGVKGGLLEGRSLSTDQVKALATLPSREQLLAQIAGGLQSPIAAFALALNGLLSTFAGALEALRTQREGA